eukprot:COSAG05_NODE_522_length_9020_cov_18.531891_8_plen_228_part_00
MINQICIVFGIVSVCCVGIFAHWRTLLYITLAMTLSSIGLCLSVISDVEKDTARTPDASSIPAESMWVALRRIWRDPIARKPFLISQGILIGQQITGVNALMMTMGTILASTGFTQDAANTISFLVQLLHLAETSCSPAIVEGAGRRATLLGTSLLCVIGMCTVYLTLVLDLPGSLAAIGVLRAYSGMSDRFGWLDGAERRRRARSARRGTVVLTTFTSPRLRRVRT